MEMSVKHFSGFMRLIHNDIAEVIDKLQDSPEKEKLQKLAYNLQKMIED